MRLLGSFSQPHDAQRLADYLLTQGISTKLEVDATQSRIWVRDEAQLATAKDICANFQSNPLDPRYDEAIATAALLRREEAQRDTEARRKMIDGRTLWTGPGGPTPVTWTLIGASVAVALLTSFGDVANSELLHDLLIVPPPRPFAPTPSLEAEIRQGEVWRLFTPALIHWSGVHLLFNMLWMHDLGRRVETTIGPVMFTLFVLLTAAVSNLAQYLAAGPMFGGMSGVVYAVIGYAWIQSRFGGQRWLYLSPNEMFFAVGWLALGAFGMIGHMANWAHGVGFVAGIVIAAVFIGSRKLRRI